MTVGYDRSEIGHNTGILPRGRRQNLRPQRRRGLLDRKGTHRPGRIARAVEVIQPDVNRVARIESRRQRDAPILRIGKRRFRSRRRNLARRNLLRRRDRLNRAAQRVHVVQERVPTRKRPAGTRGEHEGLPGCRARRSWTEWVDDLEREGRVHGPTGGPGVAARALHAASARTTAAKLGARKKASHVHVLMLAHAYAKSSRPYRM